MHEHEIITKEELRRETVYWNGGDPLYRGWYTVLSEDSDGTKLKGSVYFDGVWKAEEDASEEYGNKVLKYRTGCKNEKERLWLTN